MNVLDYFTSMDETLKEILEVQKQILAELKKKEVKETAYALADMVAEAFQKPERMSDIATEFFIDYFIASENVECARNMLITQTWYLCLRRLYESTDLIEIYGFLVEADVAPNDTYTYQIDLTGTENCCVCPVFTCYSDLGGYAKLTNLVNEPPVDVLSEKWINKYAARNMPMPSTMPVLTRGYDYVVFPKRKVKITFSNTHSTETAHCIFYADYMEMNIKDATLYMQNIYEPLISYAKIVMTKDVPEYVRLRYIKRSKILEELIKYVGEVMEM